MGLEIEIDGADFLVLAEEDGGNAAGDRDFSYASFSSRSVEHYDLASPVIRLEPKLTIEIPESYV